MKISFQIKLFLSLMALFSVIVMAMGSYGWWESGRQLYQDRGTQSRIQAQEIALIPTLRTAVAEGNIAQINGLMRQIVRHSDASFIVIGDAQGNHLFHSAYANRLGTPLIGGDNADVLAGKTTTTLREGGLGFSLRSKTPLWDDNHRVIGIVSVGYLTHYLDAITREKAINLLVAWLLVLSILFIFCWFFTRHIKKQMFMLEPREIGRLVRQQQALLESIFEGVIAIDERSRVVAINHAARQLLGLPVQESSLGQPLATLIRPTPFFAPLAMLEKDTHDEMTTFNNLMVLASRVRIRLEGELQGWVITFRDRHDLDRLNAKLSQVKRYADNLRIMRHEQLNHMATLAGLLHMGHYQHAMSWIDALSESAQQRLDFISSRFDSPTLCGLLMGKVSRAHEKGVAIEFDEGCQMQGAFSALTESELLSIIGNLLDNAIEATQRAAGKSQPIEVLIRLTRRELIIEVADRGVGIPPALRTHIFERGVTTKTRGDHGIGLYLIASYVAQAHGTIEVTDNLPQGTLFSLFIPCQASGQPDCGATEHAF